MFVGNVKLDNIEHTVFGACSVLPGTEEFAVKVESVITECEEQVTMLGPDLLDFEAAAADIAKFGLQPTHPVYEAPAIYGRTRLVRPLPAHLLGKRG
jgi:hypothetical protein